MGLLDEVDDISYRGGLRCHLKAGGHQGILLPRPFTMNKLLFFLLTKPELVSNSATQLEGLDRSMHLGHLHPTSGAELFPAQERRSGKFLSTLLCCPACHFCRVLPHFDHILYDKTA